MTPEEPQALPAGSYAEAKPVGANPRDDNPRGDRMPSERAPTQLLHLVFGGGLTRPLDPSAAAKPTGR